jgi:hypothetical protein
VDGDVSVVCGAVGGGVSTTTELVEVEFLWAIVRAYLQVLVVETVEFLVKIRLVEPM